MPFPVNALPPILRDMAYATARTTSTDVSMAATALLSSISYCFSGQYRIVGKKDHTEPLVIDSFIEWRIARMFMELYRKPNNFADFHGEQLAELLTYMAISGNFAQWMKQVNELDTLDAVRELSKREFDADSSGKDYEAEFMSAKDAALNIIQYSIKLN